MNSLTQGNKNTQEWTDSLQNHVKLPKLQNVITKPTKIVNKNKVAYLNVKEEIPTSAPTNKSNYRLIKIYKMTNNCFI